MPAQKAFWDKFWGTSEQNPELITLAQLKLAMENPEFLALNGATPTLLRVGKCLKVPAKRLEVLREQAKLEETAFKAQAKQEKEALKKWESELMDVTNAPAHLGVKTAEFVRWREQGKIPVSHTRTFRKWGKDLGVMLHHPNALAAVTPDLIAKWRAEEKAVTAKKRVKTQNKATEKSNITRYLTKSLKALDAGDLNYIKSGAKKEQVTFSNYSKVTLLVTPNIDIKVYNTWSAPTPKSIAEVDQLVAKVHGWVNNLQAGHPSFEYRILHDVASKIKSIPDNFTVIEKNTVIEALIDFAMKPTPAKTVVAEVSRVISDNVKSLNNKKANELRAQIAERALKVLELERYPDSYPLARSLQRHVHIVAGPTNSGKTHNALAVLSTAESGLYLAPLRLLAMEIFDRLTAQGIPCELHTGEEHLVQPGATHVCATVEMMPASREFDVAVVDEIQMLFDNQRGWAWTAALVGVAAKKVFAVGAPYAVQKTTELVEFLGETFDVKHFTRKSPLLVSPTATPLKQVEKGDAVIAFSRKDVLVLAKSLQKAGLKVSTIYGALAPEVRRTQAQLFCDGTTDVVVATDAIGMGLNLPIRRVVFSTLTKFDGLCRRTLNSTECMQIAGRAGRFGLHETGFVSAFSAYDKDTAASCLAAEVKAPLTKLHIAPTLWHINKLAELRNISDLHPNLAYFTKRVNILHPIFTTANLSDALELAIIVDEYKSLDLATRFAYACAPFSPSKPQEVDYFRRCLAAHQKQKQVGLASAPDWAHKPARKELLEQAEWRAKQLSLYAWLSHKFPETYPADKAKISSIRVIISNYINEALLLGQKKQ